MGGFDDGFGQRVEAGGREGGAESKSERFGNSARGGEVGDRWVALGEGAGFVDDEEFYFGEFFERGGVEDENAEAGGAGESAGGGDGGGESEGTGASGDKNGYGTTDGIRGRFAYENPTEGGGESEKKDERSKDASDFVSEALEGRGICAGLIDELGESGDERVGAGFFGEDEESATRDESSGEDRVADKFFDGQRFAGEDGFFDRGVAFENFSVRRDGFPGEDEEVVAELNFGAGDNFFGAVGEESGGGWGKGEESLEGV